MSCSRTVPATSARSGSISSPSGRCAKSSPHPRAGVRTGCLCARLDRLTAMLDRSGRPELAKEDMRLASLQTINRILDAMPGGRDVFGKTFMNCARNNPAALRSIVSMMAIYVHLGPFARGVIAEIDRRIAVIDEARRDMPAAAQVTAAEAVIARPLVIGSSLH